MSDSTDKNLQKVYAPSEIEEKWAERWIKEGLYEARLSKDKPRFSMVIPPPNITGSLHLGHALNNTLQDIMARYKRMTGHNVLWVPGIDHAGIATQNVIERQLKEEGLSRETLGRERFVERVWQWKEKSGSTIVNQLKRLGASCDWSRLRFTMDEGLSKAVREVFVRLYEEGLIYRADYIINWCPRCHTALSDLEVEHEDKNGFLYHIAYPLKDGSGSLVVATTRPETMLGDTAVAVNPDDERHKGLIGKSLILPLTGRDIPIIGDASVQAEFGTGAVKITPAHDFNDFETARRHNLPFITIMDSSARMNENAGAYKGLSREAARKRIVEDLKEKGLLAKEEKYTVPIGACYRCKTITEPALSKQWFVKTAPLAAPAIEAVKNGSIKFVPENWQNTYFEWMYNIKDWCISRQIWWGHRIPAWHCADCSGITVSKTEATQCVKCNGTNISQDPDVLDTWFSSALWPFSTLGWPEKTKEQDIFYPTSVLFTSFDIIFFWVARMIMMGLKFKGEVPFRDVYIHALVRDAEGQKMSKSKGNVIDPLTVMGQYGTDALRFSLAAFAAQGRDIKLSEERIEGYRNFANKIWNLARFTMMNIEGASVSEASKEKYSSSDKWILSKLSSASEEVSKCLERYEFDGAARAIYAFVWHELCDWHVEFIKPDLWGDNGEERKKTSQAVLVKVLRDSLKLLHPFMPFITEEIYSYLPGAKGFLMTAGFPENLQRFPEEEKKMECVMETIRTIRNIRTEANILPGVMVDCNIFTKNHVIMAWLKEEERHIKTLAKVSGLHILEHGERPENAAFSVVGGIKGENPVEVWIPLKGHIDAASEIKRLSKDMDKIAVELALVEKRLSNDAFVAKAPQEVIEKEKKRVSELIEKKTKLDSAIERMKNLL
ncbi:MAG: valine--tRNA ligase [Thermodesulfobacteriota bacterium]